MYDVSRAIYPSNSNHHFTISPLFQNKITTVKESKLTNSTKRKDSLRRNRARQVQQTREDGEEDGEPDGPEGCLCQGGDAPEEASVGEAAVSGECVELEEDW